MLIVTRIEHFTSGERPPRSVPNINMIKPISGGAGRGGGGVLNRDGVQGHAAEDQNQI